MKLIVDADSVSYAVAFACQETTYLVMDTELGFPVSEHATKKEAQKEAEYFGPEYEVEPLAYPSSVGIVHWQTDKMVRRILENASGTAEEYGLDTSEVEYQLYLTSDDKDDNFRLQVDPNYKNNRKDFVKPYHYHTVRERLVEEWGAEIVKGWEADDSTAMEAGEGRILVSIDKDLDQVPGYHYSWETHNKTKSFYYLSLEEARKNFWTQVLTGDTADNIYGLHRVGPKKAASILQQCETDKDYYEACRKQYEVHNRLEDLDKNCELLYLLRSPDDSWERFKESFYYD